MGEGGDNYAELSDGDLVRRIGARPEGSASTEEAELYRRLGMRVRSYGMRHLRSDDRARELVQRVMLVTLEKVRSGAVREPDKVGSFVLGTARMITREMFRDAARSRPLEEAPEPVTDPPPPDPLAGERLADCMRRLPDRDRMVVTLSFYAQEPAARIAARIGTTSGNVRVIRHRAVARLRDCMDPAPEGDA